ncbi:hypothetical protein GSI_12345 [Ganoderma sinense ZZ0214-1]|uniref:Uncharacterized protein n=1 Tax=Ganoderma sinense ZZ0214-1 TaxID=1077348 RepID=A0A2G8RYM6_9APHY|nr:hypothetical protein GSI_12345 [Ganoderma sinense ZZ0214-1]
MLQTPKGQGMTVASDETMSFPSDFPSFFDLTKFRFSFSAVTRHSELAILASQPEQDTFQNLHRRAQEYLKVFEDPRYFHLDTPLWVMRVWPGASEPVCGRRMFTVCNAVKTMYDTAEDLGIDWLGGGPGGRTYVATAVCAVAADVDAEFAGSKASDEEKEGAVVPGVDVGCVLDVAVYVFMRTDSRRNECSISNLALLDWLRPWFSKGAPLEEAVTKGLQRNEVSPSLKEKDLPKGNQDDLKTDHFFKRSLAVYSNQNGSESGRDEFDSMAVTLEILQLYCELDRSYVDDAAAERDRGE